MNNLKKVLLAGIGLTAMTVDKAGVRGQMVQSQ